jgi:hypothetical protein
MKKIFSILFICCTTFAFADNAPVFEETDENVNACAYSTFAAEDPIFEEDVEKEARNQCKDCPPRRHSKEQPKALLRAESSLPQCAKRTLESGINASYVSWKRYKSNFGMEKLFVRFPNSPTITQGNGLLTAYAWDYGIMYSLTGYFPSVGNILPIVWFDEILYSLDHYPYTLISHVVFQASNGDWVMDYVAHDYIQNTILKARAIVTPFNGYTLQCVKPNGARDHFDYFLDNFYIKCECH